MSNPETLQTDQLALLAQFVATNSHTKPKLSVLSPKDKGTYEFTTRGDPTDAIQKARDGGKNIGMHLVNIADIDIDIKPEGDDNEMQAALKMADFEASKFILKRVLPAGVAFGTQKRPGSHIMFGYNGDDASLYNVKIGGRVRIEARTGEGSHTVMPGSMHPTDGCYAFEPGADLFSAVTLLDANQINDGVSLANVFVDVYKEWNEGMRNEIVKGLAGTMFYAEHAAISAGHDHTPASLENAIKLVEAIMEYTGDDDKTRVRTVRATWQHGTKQLEGGGNRFIKSLKQDFPELHDRVMMALRIDKGSMEYVQFRDEKVLLPVGKRVIDLSQRTPGGMFAEMSFDDLVFFYAHKYANDKSMTAALKVDHLTTRCTATVMRPVPLKQGLKLLHNPPSAQNFIYTTTEETLDANGNTTQSVNHYFNTYAGPPFHPWPEEVKYEDVEDGLWFIRESLACGPDATTEEERKRREHTMLAFLADIVQDPANKPSLAIVLTGIGGTGKTAYTMLGQAILRDAMCSPAMALNDFLDDKGGSDYGDKLLVCVPESSTKGLNATAKVTVEQKLKTLITEDKARVRMMRENPESIQNYVRVILNSNYPDHPVPIDAAATRRYFVVTPSEEWSEKALGAHRERSQERWEKTFKWLADPQNKRKLLRFFGDYEYSKRDIQGPYKTPELDRLLMRRGDTVDEWLMWAVAENNHPVPATLDGASEWVATLKGQEFVPYKANGQNYLPKQLDVSEWPTRVSMDALYNAYKYWYIAMARNDRRLSNRYQLTSTELGRKLQSIMVNGSSILGPKSTSTKLKREGENPKVVKLREFADRRTIAKYLIEKYPFSDTLQEVVHGHDDGSELPSEF